MSNKGWNIHNFYDNAESATMDKREQLQQLIANAKANKFDIILLRSYQD